MNDLVREAALAAMGGEAQNGPSGCLLGLDLRGLPRLPVQITDRLPEYALTGRSGAGSRHLRLARVLFHGIGFGATSLLSSRSDNGILW